jgi:hypothetical protein
MGDRINAVTAERTTPQQATGTKPHATHSSVARDRLGHVIRT